MQKHGARLKGRGFLKVRLLGQCKVSLCLLPERPAAGSQGSSRTRHPFRAAGIPVGFPAPEFVPPFTLYLWTQQTALEPV